MPASNRERLLEAAIACIQRQGAAATTARDVAAEAKGSLGSIPYHFGTMDALLDEALLKAMVRYTDDLSANLIPSSQTPGLFVDEMLASAIASFEANRPLLISLIETYSRALHSEGLRQRAAQHRAGLIAGLAAVIEPCLPDTPERSRYAQSLGLVLLVVFNGMAIHWLVDGGEPLEDQILHEAVRQAGPALFAASMQDVGSGPFHPGT